MPGKIRKSNAAGIMNSNVVTVKESENLENTVKIMAKKGIGSVIVTNNGEAFGIITESDIIRILAKKGRHFFDLRAGEVMSKPLVTIIPSTDIEKIEKEMKRRNLRHLAVVASGNVVGIITSKDVVDYLGKWKF
ncbi:hypothetical protein BEH94_04740 [Candidatus Altiarchaeales archaeon WOR_SM1_SCG]|nr:hypothetical protein BEH94_04740 [Candidatus Altiarchaeales archaeon WOR_SM1_SCG]